MIDFSKAVDRLIAKDNELQAAIKQVQEQQARQHEIQRTREDISKKDQEILNLESQLKEAENILVSEEAQVLVKAIMFYFCITSCSVPYDVLAYHPGREAVEKLLADIMLRAICGNLNLNFI